MSAGPPASGAARTVRCPTCGGATAYAPANPALEFAVLLTPFVNGGVRFDDGPLEGIF